MDAEVLEHGLGDFSGKDPPPIQRPDREGEPRHQREHQAPSDDPQPAGRNEPDRPLQAEPGITADQGKGQFVSIRLGVAHLCSLLSPFPLLFKARGAPASPSSRNQGIAQLYLTPERLKTIRACGEYRSYVPFGGRHAVRYRTTGKNLTGSERNRHDREQEQADRRRNGKRRVCLEAYSPLANIHAPFVKTRRRWRTDRGDSNSCRR